MKNLYLDTNARNKLKGVIPITIHSGHSEFQLFLKKLNIKYDKELLQEKKWGYKYLIEKPAGQRGRELRDKIKSFVNV